MTPSDAAAVAKVQRLMQGERIALLRCCVCRRGEGVQELGNAADPLCMQSEIQGYFMYGQSLCSYSL